MTDLKINHDWECMDERITILNVFIYIVEHKPFEHKEEA